MRTGAKRKCLSCKVQKQNQATQSQLESSKYAGKGVVDSESGHAGWQCQYADNRLRGRIWCSRKCGQRTKKEGSTKGPAGHVNHSPRAAFTEREGKRGIGRIELLGADS
jgi:hypothetical protein